MITINNLKQSEKNKDIFRSITYKSLSRKLIVIYALFMLVYMFREDLYKLDNQYITLFAGTVPNLIPSFLFTVVGMFYIVPFLKGINSITKPTYIWLINGLNIIVFMFIEYLHVIFKLGSWDNNDMIASLIGIMISTIIYYKYRENFVKKHSNYL